MWVQLEIYSISLELMEFRVREREYLEIKSTKNFQKAKSSNSVPLYALKSSIDLFIEKNVVDFNYFF